MEQKKQEQIILIVLIPIFLLGLLYMRSRGTRWAKSGYETSMLNIGADEEIAKIAEPKDVIDVKFEGSDKDPLKNLHKSYMYELAKKEPIEEVKENLSLPAITINGLVWNTAKPQAIVNDKIVGIGEKIGGAKLIKIDKSGITIEYQGKVIYVAKDKKGDKE